MVGVHCGGERRMGVGRGSGGGSNDSSGVSGFPGTVLVQV